MGGVARKFRLQWSAPQTGRRIMVFAALMLTGFLGLSLVGAATFVIHSEAESGAVAGNAANYYSQSASGSNAVRFGNAAASSYLPFDMPSQATLKASPKKVFAHYFPPYPISIDNKTAETDYYTLQYLTPTGENNKHVAYGGWLRQRPLPRPVNPSADWKLEDYKTEVRRATEAGLDGFAFDILNTGNIGGTVAYWDRLNLLLQAAPQVDPSFKIMLMPDTNVLRNIDPAKLASAIASIADEPAAYRLADGRLVISPFAPDIVGADWWQDWLAIMKNQYDIDIAFVPCLLDYAAHVDEFAPISYGIGNWGFRSPAANSNLLPRMADAHSRGKLWMQPVSLQDQRPYDGIYDEANNSENLRLTWNSSITGGADWVQMMTWNDYSEHTEFSPSTHTGWSPLDISSYYITKYKTGSAPAIQRDVLYVSHRRQPHAAQPTGGQSELMSLRAGSSPARDTVEVLSFLQAESVVTVNVGSQTHTYTAPAGVSARTYPLQTGTVSARASRSSVEVAQVTSPFTVQSALPVQDLQYHFAGSARD